MNFGGLVYRVGGDGFLDIKRKMAAIDYHKNEIDSAEWDLSLIKILDPFHKGKIREYKNKNAIRIRSAALYRLCASYGWTTTLNKLIITPQIEKETPEFHWEGVGYFFGADGFLGFQENKTTPIMKINQGDRNLIKLTNKKQMIFFIQKILKSVGIESSISYREPHTRTSKGVVINAGGEYKLQILFSKNPHTASIFRDHFPMHNEAKEATLDKMIELEKIE